MLSHRPLWAACGRGHSALGLPYYYKRDSESPPRNFTMMWWVFFPNLKYINHYRRQMWHQNDQKSINFNVTDNCKCPPVNSRILTSFAFFGNLPQGIMLHCCHIVMRKHTQMSKWAISSPLGQKYHILGVTSCDTWCQPRVCIKPSASRSGASTHMVNNICYIFYHSGTDMGHFALHLYYAEHLG